MVIEIAQEQSLVGTFLSLQMASGFMLTCLTIWLIPVLRDEITWNYSLSTLSIGPFLGIIAMIILRRLPEATKLAHGKK